ncbi:MAG: phosphomannomutase/phosphoglucomutase [Bryobacterales bacterium]|nr:phosphomannomutase/phosphoglucomutase [Bryobacterales bacterium]
MLNPTVFREYDIRGVAERDLPSEGVESLGRAIGTFVRRQAAAGSGAPRMMTGADCRLSSPRLRTAIAKGLRLAGCDVADIGTVPTPVTYHSVLQSGAAGGVMVTGSHNPADYNGFKVMLGASTIHGEDIQELRRIIEAGDFTSGEGSLATVDAVTPYVEDVAARFAFPRRVKAVFDGGNGTAGPVLKRILSCLNVEPIELFFEMDGHFPNHHPDPTVPKYLAHLQAAVRESGAELGIAFDGDSDRIGAVDERGEVVYGDMLMLIFAREILARRPGATFISEVKSSQILYDKIAELGGRPIMWKTGHSLIKAKMKQEGAALAGEMSGHMFFADGYYGYDDALYAALRLIDIVSRSGRPLSGQLEGIPVMHSTPEIRVDSEDETKFAIVAEAARMLAERSYPVDETDGVRVRFSNGWGLLRASNTQPVLVMRFEAGTAEDLAEYQATMDDLLAEATVRVS